MVLALYKRQKTLSRERRIKKTNLFWLRKWKPIRWPIFVFSSFVFDKNVLLLEDNKYPLREWTHPLGTSWDVTWWSQKPMLLIHFCLCSLKSRDIIKSTWLWPFYCPLSSKLFFILYLFSILLVHFTYITDVYIKCFHMCKWAYLVFPSVYSV